MELIGNPKTSSKQPRMVTTDTDIVTGLRHHDPDIRRQALEALFPESTAILVNPTKTGTNTTTTSKLDANRSFIALLFVAQGLGRFLGMELNWIQAPPKQDGIQIVPGDAMPN